MMVPTAMQIAVRHPGARNADFSFLHYIYYGGAPIPPDLHRQFVVASTVTNLIFWVLLGGLVGALRSRFFGTSGLARNQLA